MSNFHDRKDYWKPCRPGTILSVSDSKFQRDRRRFLIRATMGSVVAGAGLLSSVFVLSQRSRRAAADAGDGAAEAAIDSVQLVDSRTSQTAPKRTNAVNKGHVRRKFHCPDVIQNLDNYVAAVRKKESSRTQHQHELIAGVDNHIQVCGKCKVKVSDALQNA